MRTRTALASAATLCLLTLLTGCGNGAGDGAGDTADEPAASEPTSEEATEEPSEPESEPAPASSAPAEEVVITIEEFMYSQLGPVAPGTEITIENSDAEAHTVTADGKGEFDVTILPGKSETLTAPEKAGRYPYLCSFHSGMTATIVVE